MWQNKIPPGTKYVLAWHDPDDGNCLIAAPSYAALRRTWARVLERSEGEPVPQRYWTDVHADNALAPAVAAAEAAEAYETEISKFRRWVSDALRCYWRSHGGQLPPDTEHIVTTCSQCYAPAKVVDEFAPEGCEECEYEALKFNDIVAWYERTKDVWCHRPTYYVD